MRLSDFDFFLPQKLIAQAPSQERDGSRLMILDRETGGLTHTSFRDFPAYLSKKDRLVLNNTRVIPARTWGTKGAATIEFLFLREVKEQTWEVLCRPAKKVQKGDDIVFSPELKGRVTGEGKEGRRTLFFPFANVGAEMEKIGYAPLPPYIKRQQEQTEKRISDLERYQTVFAQKRGSIAAPTAGLHFTKPMLQSIQSKGVLVTEITLDVGLATFQPVREDHIENHRMLRETYTISSQSADSINTAKSESCPVVAVGTTTVRTLESAGLTGEVQAGTHETDLFIYPGFSFRITDRLLTNFHLPKSSLLMMVGAFAGLDLIKKAYREAVRLEYRFFSYGDCMLII